MCVTFISRLLYNTHAKYSLVSIVKDTFLLRQCLFNCIAFQITELATRAPSSAARTASAFPSCGCAIPTMIAVMTVTSRRTCVGKRIAQLDGNGVQDMRITGASRSGYSATARTIAVMVPTSARRTVRSVTPIWTSSAPITDVCRSNGFAILPTIAETAATRQTRCARISTASAPSLSSSARTANVLHPDGDATAKTTAVTTVTRKNAINGSVRYVDGLKKKKFL